MITEPGNPVVGADYWAHDVPTLVITDSTCLVTGYCHDRRDVRDLASRVQ